MAVIVVSALGLADYATGTSNFSDMGGHWSNSFVAYATSLGVIAGYPDGTFKPDKTVSYDEAATMLVAALGYNADSLTGTWPANFVVKAKSLGILDGIKAGPAGANRGDIAIMAFQTLDALIGSTDKDGKWTANDPDDTMLDRLGAELYNDGDAFVVDGDEDSVINLRPFLGAYVTAYQNGDDEIIAIKEVKSVYLTGKYDPVDNVFETDDVDYNIASNLLTITHPEALAFVNGEVTGTGAELNDDGKVVDFDFGDADESLLEDDLTIAAKVSGKRITELYSVAAWKVDAAFIIADSDLEDIDEDQVLDDFEFILDNNDDIDMGEFDLLGVDSLDDLDEGYVVYIYANKDDEIRKLAVGTEVVSGEITKKTSGDKYTIGGKALERAAASFDFPATFEGVVGDEVEAVLDFYGDIFEMTKTDGTTDNYAVVLETGDGSGGGLTGFNPALKLFLADGTVKTFDVDASEVDDGTIIGEDEKWVGSWAGKAKAGRIIEYGVDKDGVVTEITEVRNASGDDDVSAKGYYEGKKIASDAIIFTYEGDGTEKERSDKANYGVIDRDDILDTDDVLAMYVLDGTEIVVMLVLDYEVTDSVFGVVTDYAEISGDADYELTFLIDGKEVTYEATKSAFEDIDSYDEVYEISFNASGEVSELVVVNYDVHLDEPDRDGYVLDEEYTLDSDVVVYKWNGTEYEKAALRDINSATDVYLYDTVGAKRVYDIVLLGGSPSTGL
jgi:hypothetical protein